MSVAREAPEGGRINQTDVAFDELGECGFGSGIAIAAEKFGIISDMIE